MCPLKTFSWWKGRPLMAWVGFQQMVNWQSSGLQRHSSEAFLLFMAITVMRKTVQVEKDTKYEKNGHSRELFEIFWTLTYVHPTHHWWGERAPASDINQIFFFKVSNGLFSVTERVHENTKFWKKKFLYMYTCENVCQFEYLTSVPEPFVHLLVWKRGSWQAVCMVCMFSLRHAIIAYYGRSGVPLLGTGTNLLICRILYPSHWRMRCSWKADHSPGHPVAVLCHWSTVLHCCCCCARVHFCPWHDPILSASPWNRGVHHGATIVCCPRCCCSVQTWVERSYSRTVYPCWIWTNVQKHSKRSRYLLEITSHKHSHYCLDYHIEKIDTIVTYWVLSITQIPITLHKNPACEFEDWMHKTQVKLCKIACCLRAKLAEKKSTHIFQLVNVVSIVPTTDSDFCIVSLPWQLHVWKDPVWYLVSYFLGRYFLLDPVCYRAKIILLHVIKNCILWFMCCQSGNNSKYVCVDHGCVVLCGDADVVATKWDVSHMKSLFTQQITQFYTWANAYHSFSPHSPQNWLLYLDIFPEKKHFVLSSFKRRVSPWEMLFLLVFWKNLKRSYG